MLIIFRLAIVETGDLCPPVVHLPHVQSGRNLALLLTRLGQYITFCIDDHALAKEIQLADQAAGVARDDKELILHGPRP